MATSVNRRSLVSMLAAIPFFRFLKPKSPALLETFERRQKAMRAGVYHDGAFCNLCSGISELLHKRGPWTPEQYARLRNNIADAVTEAEQGIAAIRATTGYMRQVLGNPDTSAILESRGLKADFERVLAAMADKQLQLHYSPFIGALHG